MISHALQFLKTNKINYELFEYEHKIKGAKFAAESLNVPLNQMIKTIILKGSDNGYYIALMPGDKEISLKRTARILKLKNVELASTKDAENVTGYKVGGISPFGTKKKMKIIMEKSLLSFQNIYINGGKRGYIINIELQDLIALLNPVIEDITK